MGEVVRRGTARDLGRREPRLAGKTGTAQTANGAAHGWFTGFAPVDHPAIAMAVVVEHGGAGCASAGPIAQIIAKIYLASQS